MKGLGLRAWSIKKHKFLNIDTLYCANGKVCAVVENGVVYDIEDVILEQDTDLKDKNGKPIWEGDVVKVEDDEYTADTDKFLGYNATVIRSIYHAGAFAVKNWWGDRILEWDVKLRRVEVIGNVHENPELIKEEE